ncbi:hypothetical protein YC2023_020527 [Brassica napus]
MDYQVRCHWFNTRSWIYFRICVLNFENIIYTHKIFEINRYIIRILWDACQNLAFLSLFRNGSSLSSPVTPRRLRLPSMISRRPWPLLDDSIGEISSRQLSGVRVGLIAVSVSLLDGSESLSVSSTTPRLCYSPRGDSATL